MKNLKSEKLRMPLLFVIGIILSFAIVSCNQTAEDTASDEEIIEVTEGVDVVEVIEEDIWIIDEHQINNIPVTSKAKIEDKSQEPETVNKDEELAPEEEAYAIATIAALDAALLEEEYEAMEEVETTIAVIPLDETQTLISYGKKDEVQAGLQVISSGEDGEIEQIIFTDKKHKDVYDVQAGMSGKEVKKLRKEVKHMVKKGKVFLYDDSSNIMYLMDTKNMQGDELVEVDIENLDVQAIIWKDKKHHKKQ